MNYPLCTWAHTQTRADRHTRRSMQTQCEHLPQQRPTCYQTQRKIQTDAPHIGHKKHSRTHSLASTLHCIIWLKEQHFKWFGVWRGLFAPQSCTINNNKYLGKRTNTHNQWIRQVVTYLHLHRAESCWLKKRQERRNVLDKNITKAETIKQWTNLWVGRKSATILITILIWFNITVF